MEGDRPLYKVNELDVYDENTALNTFIETTRWLGLKLRLVGENLTHLDQVRDRTVFTGRRGLSPVDFREVETGKEGIRLTVSLSGSF